MQIGLPRLEPIQRIMIDTKLRRGLTRSLDSATTLKGRPKIRLP
jgi:hypothetical protein